MHQHAMQRIYLDHNATTPMRPEVLEAMLPYFTGTFGNPSSVHWAGRQAKHALETARDQVATLIGATSSEILFTSGGTESNNLAVHGVLQPRDATPFRLVTTPIEHSSVLETLKALGPNGAAVEVVTLAVNDQGRVSPSDLEAVLTPDTALVSIGLANHEIGTLQPIRELSPAMRRHAIPFHVDAVQAAGKIPLDVNQLGVDLLSLSAHKIYGPKGIGALYVRQGITLSALFCGGPQEREKRPGTENVAAAVGFGCAAQLCAQDIETTPPRLIYLIARLWDGIQRYIPDVVRYTPTRACLPNTLNVGFAGASGEGVMMGLDLAGVAVSTGSACAAGSVEPSHVLLAVGCDKAGAKSATRFSAGRDTTEEDIDAVIQLLPGIVERVRKAGRSG